MVVRLYLVLFNLLVSLNAFAQTCDYTLKGTVQEKNGDPLPGATLILSGKATSSQGDGSFEFKDLCAGALELTVKYIGYDDSHLTITLKENSKVIVTLTPSATTLNEVQISGTVTQTGFTNSSFSLSKEELAHFSGKSLGEALKRVPGVSALQSGPAIFKPVIDGLHSQRILILNNGIRQEGQQWGIEHAPEIDPFIASEIKVVKGSEAVRYGSDAIGGVIIVDTPPMHQAQKFGGELNAGIATNNRMGVFSGLLEGGFKKFENMSWRLQSSVKKGGDYSTPDYVLSNTGAQELNFSGALGLKKEDKGIEVYFSSFNTQIGILRTAHTGNLENLDNSIRDEQPWYVRDFTYDINAPKQKINHQLLKVSAFKKLKDVGTLHVLYGGQYNQRKEFDIRRGGRTDQPALSLDLFSNVVDAYLNHTLAGFEGTIGVNGTYKDNYNNVAETGIRPLIPNYKQVNAGLFLVEKYRKDKWLLEAGARLDHQYLQVLAYVNNTVLVKPQFNLTYASGSFGASYYFNDYARLSSHAALSSRPPHVSELYSDGLHRGLAAIEYGLLNQNGFQTDQNLVKKETSAKWTNGFQFIRKAFSLEVSAYLNRITNYVYLKPAGTELRAQGLFLVYDYSQTDALLTGIDGLVHWDVSRHFEYSGTFAYLYAKDITHNDVLTFIPPAQMENSLTYRLKKSEREFFFTVSLPVGFKQNRAPVTVYPTDAADYEGEKVYDFAPAPNGYALLNAEAGIKIPVREHILSISVDGENLLNKSYRVYMNRLRYFADETGTNIMLRLKYNFHSDE